MQKYVLDTRESVSGVKASDSEGNIFFVSLDIYASVGDGGSIGLFEFFAKNSEVEWSHVKTTKDGIDMSYVVTSKEIGVDAGIDFMTKRISSQNSRNSMANFLMGSLGINIREGNHSHPNNTTTVSVGDLNVANNLQSKFPNALMHIYTPIDGVYTPFNRYSQTGLLPEIEVIGSPF